MKILISLFVSISFVSCGGSSGGGGGGNSSSSSIVPMISNIECSSGSCVGNSLTKDATTSLSTARDFYDEINDTLIPNVKNTFSEIDDVLELAGIDSCDAIPASGSTNVSYNGATITVTGASPTQTDIFGSGIDATKAVEASVGGAKFFEAQFNCVSPRVGYIKGDLTVIDPTDFDKFIIYFYENGDDKKLNLFTHYLEGSDQAGYMVLFETDGTDFNSYYSWDSNLSGAGFELTLSANYSATNGGRIAIETSEASDFVADDISGTISEGSNVGAEHHCYTSSLVAESCGVSHPSIGQINANNISWGFGDSAITAFQVSDTQSLDFSF